MVLTLTLLPVVQLANILSTEALFYACIFPFIAFFGSFAFVMYPLRDVLHPTRKFSAFTPNCVFAPVTMPCCHCAECVNKLSNLVSYYTSAK